MTGFPLNFQVQARRRKEHVLKSPAPGSSSPTWTLGLEVRASWAILNLPNLKPVYIHPQSSERSQASMVSPVPDVAKATMVLPGVPGLASDTWLLSPPFSLTSLASLLQKQPSVCASNEWTFVQKGRETAWVSVGGPCHSRSALSLWQESSHRHW